MPMRSANSSCVISNLYRTTPATRGTLECAYSSAAGLGYPFLWLSVCFSGQQPVHRFCLPAKPARVPANREKYRELLSFWCSSSGVSVTKSKRTNALGTKDTIDRTGKYQGWYVACAVIVNYFSPRQSETQGNRCSPRARPKSIVFERYLKNNSQPEFDLPGCRKRIDTTSYSHPIHVMCGGSRSIDLPLCPR